MANLGAEWVCAWCKAAFVTSANYPAAAAKGGLQEQARLQGGVWPALEVTSEEVEVAAAAAAAAATDDLGELLPRIRFSLSWCVRL